MISIIITAYKEAQSIKKCIDSFLSQNIKENYEIIVLAPDEETLESAGKYKKVITIKDSGKGKPTALNLAFMAAKGSILILTDGDVYAGKNSVNELLEKLKDKKTGAVSGRAISTNPRNTMLGFWSHLLTDRGAHEERKRLSKENKFLACSGYLYAVRKGVIESIPNNSLSDDAVISHIIYKKGYKIDYAEKAEVYVKYPTNLKDWIKQKRRSIGGYVQISKWFPENKGMRTFSKESSHFFKALSYCKNIKEPFYFIILVIFRIYVWLLTIWDLKITKKEFSKIWQRVESTK